MASRSLCSFFLGLTLLGALTSCAAAPAEPSGQFTLRHDVDDIVLEWDLSLEDLIQNLKDASGSDYWVEGRGEIVSVSEARIAVIANEPMHERVCMVLTDIRTMASQQPANH